MQVFWESREPVKRTQSRINLWQFYIYNRNLNQINLFHLFTFALLPLFWRHLLFLNAEGKHFTSYVHCFSLVSVFLRRVERNKNLSRSNLLISLNSFITFEKYVYLTYIRTNDRIYPVTDQSIFETQFRFNKQPLSSLSNGTFMFSTSIKLTKRT